MSVAVGSNARSVDLAGKQQDWLAGLVATALMDARIAAVGLRETIIPAWPPLHRILPEHLARRLEDADVFNDGFVDDLGRFIELLTAKIEAETFVGWEVDLNHVRGGYEFFHLEDETLALSSCANDLRNVQEAITAVLCSVRAMHLVDELLGA